MATLLLALAVAPLAEATFPGKPGRIAYSVALPGSDQSTPGTVPPDYPVVNQGADIFSVNPDGSDRRQLTTNGPEPNDDAGAAWSPDGSLIAYHSAFPFTPGTPYPRRPESSIFLMSADGSSQRPVPNTGGASPVFSVDGLRLFFSWTAVDLITSGVRSVNLDGSGGRDEPRTVLENYGPHISPDGRFKVYTKGLNTPPGPDVYISRVNGTDERQLNTTPDISEFNPVFAPDGSAIAYSAIRSASSQFQSEIVVLELATGALRTVSDPSVPSFDSDWGAIPVNCRKTRATLVGTAGNDTLKGTPGRDVLAGLGGRDKLIGFKGRDTLCGGKGKDKLVGGKGRDKLIQGG